MRRLSIIVIVLIAVFSTSTLQSFSQDEKRTRRVRLGAKAGFPNMVSFNGEFVLPILGNRIAPTIDYSKFAQEFEGDEFSFNYFEAGVNVYLRSKARGLYGSISLINMKADATFTDLSSDIDPSLTGGEATTEIKLNSMAIKAGLKFGSFFYIRTEVGYLITPLENSIDVDVTFQEFTETQSVEIPEILTRGLIANIGIGISF